MKLLSLVFSFRNEEENLDDLISRLNNSLTKLSNWNFEYIFVNDDSSDKSEEILISLQKNNPIKIINLSRRFGIGPGILAGLNEAKGDAVIYMDSDLQDPPELIPDLAQRWRDGHDVVFAVRRKRKENIVKRLCYWLFSRLLSKVTAFEIPLDSGDFALMDRRIVDILNQLPEKNRFVRGLRSWVGLKQSGIDYERSARHGGKPKYSYRGLVRLAYDGLTSFSDAPLRLATSLGILFTVTAVQDNLSSS